MADGYAQASGTPTHVNLAHGARASATAMGAIFNAQANKSPLLVTAGQQARSLMTLQANLTNRDAVAHARTRSSSGATSRRAREDVPARARARHPPRVAAAAGARRSSRSRWTTGAPRSTTDAVAHQTARSGRPARAVADPARSRDARRSGSTPPSNPVLVAGPDIDASRRLGRRDRARRAPAPARVGDRRRPAAGGSASPRTTRTSRACCRRDRARSARRWRATTSCSSPARRCSRYYPNIPGAAAARGTRAGRDHERPRRGRARADGRRDRRRRRADAAGAASTRSATSDRERARAAPPPPSPRRSPTRSARRRPCTRARRRVPRATGSSCSSRRRARSRCATSCASRSPGSYYFGAGGGLGFGLAAVDRRPARAARPPGRLRARRGLGAVRDPGVLDAPPPTRCRSRSSCCATRSTRSSSGSPRSRTSTGAPGARPAGARRRRRWRAATASTRASVDGARRAARGAGEAIASDGPQLVEVERRAGHGAGLSACRWRCSRRTSRRIAPAGPQPAADRAPDSLAAGTPRAAARGADGAARRGARADARDRPDPLRLRRQPLPAVPAGRGDGPRRRRRRQGARLRAAAPARRSTFRGGGTSLNGQAQTDGILVDVRRHWSRRARSRTAARARACGRARVLGLRQPRARAGTARARPRSRRAPTSRRSAA